MLCRLLRSSVELAYRTVKREQRENLSERVSACRLDATVVNMTWLFYALLSAGASALTAVLAKFGVEGVP